MMHAENGPAIDVLVAQALSRGETAPASTPTRPVEMEEEATHRAIMLAKVAKAPLYVVHMSAKEAVETVSSRPRHGRQRVRRDLPAIPVLQLRRAPVAAGLRGCQVRVLHSDPSRAEGHQDALWRYLRTNDLSVVATDHCPFCMKDQKDLGVGDFSKIPNGIGGVEHRMDTIYQGVVTGQISLPRWVELCATTPARMFGLYPQKGVLLPGSDADVVVYDPKAKTKIGINDTHHMNMDHSAYEGIVIDGKVDTVVSQRSGRHRGQRLRRPEGSRPLPQARPLAVPRLRRNHEAHQPLDQRSGRRGHVGPYRSGVESGHR